LKSILHKPYPFLNNSYPAAILKVLLVGFLACFFLYNFDNDGEPLWLFVTEGFIIAVCQFLFLFLLPKALIKNHNLSQVTIGQYIICLLFLILIGYASLYAYLFGYFHHRSLSFHIFFFCFFKNEIATGLLIILIVVCLDYVFVLRQELNTIKVINHQIINHKPQADIQFGFHVVRNEIESPTEIKQLVEPHFSFNDEIQKSTLDVLKANVLFVKGADNYIEVFYNKDDNQLTKQLIRNKLSSIELDAKNDFLMRVHRSYLCNLEKVVRISGNSKGYIMHFADTDEVVPVSRSKSEVVLGKLNQLFKR
jgi:DNA-binding LytR/AlgR family response regulator